MDNFCCFDSLTFSTHVFFYFFTSLLLYSHVAFTFFHVYLDPNPYSIIAIKDMALHFQMILPISLVLAIILSGNKQPYIHLFLFYIIIYRWFKTVINC